jgi:hypothetical protein
MVLSLQYCKDRIRSLIGILLICLCVFFIQLDEYRFIKKCGDDHYIYMVIEGNIVTYQEVIDEERVEALKFLYGQ